jgi:hypothetical protein
MVVGVPQFSQRNGLILPLLVRTFALTKDNLRPCGTKR